MAGAAPARQEPRISDSQLKTHAFLVALAAVGLSACVDPVTPAAGVATQDDAGVGSVASVSVGREHTCALTTAGDAYCWGSNEFGQVGVAIGTVNCARDDRSVPCEPIPKAVAGGLKFQRIAAGGTHTCGVAMNGRIYCWGDNERGQLGEPTTAYATVPQLALTTALFSDVVTGTTHTCGLRTDGAAVCWGSNDMGQLGVSTANIGTANPITVPTNLRFTSISAGDRRTCGRQSSGAVWCWGSHWVARTIAGEEVTRSQGSPFQLQIAPAFRQVTVGGLTTCGLALDGAAWCWEGNPTGAMGDGTRSGSIIPQPVETDLRFTSISAGVNATCASADSGLIYCWGAADEGQLGISASRVPHCPAGAVSCYLSPNKTSGWRVYSAVAMGVGNHACGITLKANVYCWGAGSMGQRGDGSAGSLWWPTRAPLP